MNASRRDSARLLSLAAHEFRTPMTIVAGYLRMLLRDPGQLTGQQRRLIEEADRACGRLADLVADMSDLANLEAGGATFNRAAVPLLPLLQEVVSQAAVANRPVRIEWRGDERRDVLHGDPVRLRAALGAILASTVREAVKADRIIVHGRVTEEDGRRTAIILMGDDACVAELEAADPRRLSVFDEWRGGTGLGLAIARRVIEAHEGRVWSPPGRNRRGGAVVHLPVTAASPGAAS
jgi:signal transduction histidine kinase